MNRLSTRKPRNKYGTHHSSGLRAANQDQRKKVVNATLKNMRRMRIARVGGKTVRPASTLARSLMEDFHSHRRTTPITRRMRRCRRTPMLVQYSFRLRVG